MRRTFQIAVLLILIGCAPRADAAVAVVDSHAGPWLNSANPTKSYGTGDNIGPTIISSGFDFTAGGVFTITYQSGLTSPFAFVAPYADGEGDTNVLVNDSLGTFSQPLPSFYSPSADYPAYLNELMGTFADSAGVIVGTPFEIGNGASVIVPAGATRLQLGLNDDIFSDNTGSLTVLVDGPAVGAVPEPASLIVWSVLGIAGIVAYRRRKAA